MLSLRFACAAVMFVLPLVAADVTPPSSPGGLIATAASCGQVDLAWQAASDEAGGSGVKAYIINRAEGVTSMDTATIGAIRTTFSDTNSVTSSTTWTYAVAATDNAGNRSAPSSPVTVTTPACPLSPGEILVDGAYLGPLGKNIATYGQRSVLLYIKENRTTMSWDTWAYVSDADTGQNSRFLLHTSPGYNQTETDYVLTSATELWTVSCDASIGGRVLVSQYRLNGSPVTSATLLSTKSLGDNKSKSKSMIRLQSGALMVAWNQEGWGSSAYDLTTGYAYRSPAGSWSVKFPVTVPNSGGGTIVMSTFAMAQHPADGSIWTFVKRDSFHQISALRFIEAGNDVVLDRLEPSYISVSADGDNGPEGEFPFLVAAADPTRAAILLAYQSYRDRSVFTDPLYGNGNSILLKEAPAVIAQVRPDGTKTFIPFATYMERCIQFGMSVQTDGSIWLAYQPIDHATLTWNEVYASSYANGVWSAPSMTGFNYRSYNVASGARDPGVLVYRLDRPQVAFLTPDRNIRLFTLSASEPPAPDTVPPAVSIANPPDGATMSGVVTVTATASDNVGVTRVDLLVDGKLKASKTAAPYAFSWDTQAESSGEHSLQAIAYDVAGNSSTSPAVTVTVASAADTTPPVVAIASPANGAAVKRGTTLTITATAADNVGVARVVLYVDEVLLGADAAAPYTYAWKVPAKRNVAYTLRAFAYDDAGNSSAASVTVIAK